jgi:hypothetical protein
MVKLIHWSCTAIVAAYAILIAEELLKIEYGVRLNRREQLRRSGLR